MKYNRFDAHMFIVNVLVALAMVGMLVLFAVGGAPPGAWIAIAFGCVTCPLGLINAWPHFKHFYLREKHG